MNHPKVLLTDCWTRKTVSAVRALGKQGVEVHAVSGTLLAPAIYSKYVKKHYIFPFPEEKPEEFKKKILELIKKEKFDCVMPMDEAASEILISEREDVEKYTTLPLANADVYKIANDKWETLQAAKRIGVPIPKSYMLKNIDETEQIIEKLKYPFIIKPRNSSGSRGIKKINNREEFDKHYPVIKERYGEPILQEFIPQEGQGKGVGAIVEKGNTRVSFSYKRLREYPVKGGPSTLRESTDDKVLKGYSASLLKEINWEGVAMVEFKMDVRDNVPKLMEINPRFWGSLQLAQVAGINFPYLLYLQSQNISFPEQSYKTGVRCRWLIPGDIAHFLSNPKRFSMKPSFFRFADKNTYYDQYDSSDFKGNAALIICSFLTLFSLRTWKMGVFRK